MTVCAQAIKVMTDATAAEWHRAIGAWPDNDEVALALAQAAAESALGALLKAGYEVLGPDKQPLERSAGRVA